MQLGFRSDVRHVRQGKCVLSILISPVGIYVAGDSGGFLNPAITHVENPSTVPSCSDRA